MVSPTPAMPPLKGYRTYASIAAAAIIQVAKAAGIDLGVDEQALAETLLTLAALAAAAYYRSRA